MPIGKPLSYKHAFSFSGRMALINLKGNGYIGFFNSTRQEWRPWSALGLRVSTDLRGAAMHAKGVPGGRFFVDYMTATWKASFMVLDAFIPADASVHAFSVKYDPDARPDSHWPDANLQELFKKDAKMMEQDIFAEMQKHDPKLTRESLRELLDKVRNQGLLEFDPHHGDNFWEPKRNLEKVQGRLTFQLDEEPVHYYYLDAGIRDEPTVMDRFGLWNFQIPEGRSVEFYVSDLVVNGQKIDLSRDPNWQGMNNRISFVERDFHPGQNYGYSQTNWAGEKIGEIGGLFWRNEPIDPYHGFYADDVGELSLDDAISFAGTITFANGGTDASMAFGYFNRAEQMQPPSPDNTKTKSHFMGIQLADSTSVGYSFMPVLRSGGGGASKRGPQFLPDRRRRKFSFDYDPAANDGQGRIIAKLDDQVVTIDAKKNQILRSGGGTFDRFGLLNVRSGGKYVEVYFDDLTYTVKRAADFKPQFHTDKPVRIPYPPGGRMY
jgi:hypothetical protein